MGNFYVNYTLRGPDQKSVAEVLAGRSAIVTPLHDNYVVVFDEESDQQNHEVIAELASELSGQLNCPLLAMLNHDDDILWYQLYLNGELVDEYNSTPGYFNASDEESAMAGPTGGDAKKLCAAFGSDAVEEVEDILRKPWPDGYMFAVERHADLVAAIGMPPFAVGTFAQISVREFSDILTEKDCLRTKDMVPVRPAVEPKPVPGYYKVSFRAHPGMKKSIPIGWMPTTWAGLECKEQDLSDDFLKAAFPYREKFKQLGFAEVGFKKHTRVLNPHYRDSGGINYWDNTHCCHGQLIYSKHHLPSAQREIEKVLFVFTAVFQKEILSCTNNLQKEVAPLPHHKVVRIESNDVDFLYQSFIDQLKQRMDQPHTFPDLQSLQDYFDSYQYELFADKVRQGFWVRMREFEVQAARRKLPPHLLNF